MQKAPLDVRLPALEHGISCETLLHSKVCRLAGIVGGWGAEREEGKSGAQPAHWLSGGQAGVFAGVTRMMTARLRRDGSRGR